MKPVWMLMGPTASGKTQLSLDFARRHPGKVEIICIDTVTLYRQMEIGTAKPSIEERAMVPHHMVDLLEPWESSSLHRFLQGVEASLASVWSRGRLPILVGGSALPMQGLLHGLSPLPSRSISLRRWLDQILEEPCGLQKLRSWLEICDPQAAETIHPHDPHRTCRALEVYGLSGQPLSFLQKQRSPGLLQRASQGEIALRQSLILPDSLHALEPALAQRLSNMVTAGLLEETEKLLKIQAERGVLPALKGVGYRALLPYFEGIYDLNTALKRTLFSHRALAKRQLTWMKKWPQPFEVLPLGLQGAALEACFESWDHWIQSVDLTRQQ